LACGNDCCISHANGRADALKSPRATSRPSPRRRRSDRSEEESQEENIHSAQSRAGTTKATIAQLAEPVCAFLSEASAGPPAVTLIRDRDGIVKQYVVWVYARQLPFPRPNAVFGPKRGFRSCAWGSCLCAAQRTITFQTKAPAGAMQLSYSHATKRGGLLWGMGQLPEMVQKTLGKKP
jgi:hypothetical protein